MEKTSWGSDRKEDQLKIKWSQLDIKVRMCVWVLASVHVHSHHAVAVQVHIQDFAETMCR